MPHAFQPVNQDLEQHVEQQKDISLTANYEKAGEQKKNIEEEQAIESLKKSSVNRMDAIKNMRQKPSGIPNMETRRTYEGGIDLVTGRTSSSNREE